MGEINKEYGGGLFALAVEEGIAEGMLAEIRQLIPLFTPDYLHLLINPAIPKEKRVALVGELLDGRVHPYLANFVKLMTERRLAGDIPACFAEYESLYYDTFGIIKARAESAVELTDAQKEKLQKKLEANTGKKVEIEYVIDETLIGGMRVLLNGRLFDDSVKMKLKEIGGILSDTVV